MSWDVSTICHMIIVALGCCGVICIQHAVAIHRDGQLGHWPYWVSRPTWEVTFKSVGEPVAIWVE